MDRIVRNFARVVFPLTATLIALISISPEVASQNIAAWAATFGLPNFARFLTESVFSEKVVGVIVLSLPALFAAFAIALIRDSLTEMASRDLEDD